MLLGSKSIYYWLDNMLYNNLYDSGGSIKHKQSKYRRRRKVGEDLEEIGSFKDKGALAGKQVDPSLRSDFMKSL